MEALRPHTAGERHNPEGRRLSELWEEERLHLMALPDH